MARKDGTHLREKNRGKLVAQADLLRRLGRDDEAAAAYRRALGLTAAGAEQDYLRRRLVEVTAR
jgi:RNA polymerase sigma-70 factor (ECF subfamily)